MASHVIDHAQDSMFAPIVRFWTAKRERFAELRAANAKRAATARELASYTDRELFDLGVTRANIPEILDGTFRRS